MSGREPAKCFLSAVVCLVAFYLSALDAFWKGTYSSQHLATPPPVVAAKVGPELVIGLVGATGTDFESVTVNLQNALRSVDYDSEVVHLIELLSAFPPWAELTATPLDNQIRAKMDAGDSFCSTLQGADALARLAIGNIRDHRQKRTGDETVPVGRFAYILRSLKRPEEVESLRRCYGPHFLLVGAFSPRSNRVSTLASKIATSHHSALSDDYRSAAESLVQRDLSDQSKAWGQRVGDTFPMADFFVDASKPDELAKGLQRFVKLVFGHPYHTPTRAEYGMFHAETAAMRSSALSRQVGAAIATPTGSIIAVGTNDVPKCGGGLYWEDDVPDGRDHNQQYDSSDVVRRNMLAEVLERLSKAGWLDAAKAANPIDTLVEEALQQREPPILRGTQVMRVIEYGRAVHAEMSAIVDAALRGVSVLDGTLYTTTYPCHNCARHIIAAGIRRVVYREPYPKSLTSELHRDAMANDSGTDGIVAFQAFIGLAPRRYMQYFEMVVRKDSRGRVLTWDGHSALPRGVPDTRFYISNEVVDWKQFTKSMDEAKILTATPMENNNG